MNLKSILNKVFKFIKPINKVESDNSYCYSDIIWNTRDNLIILLSYSEKYFSDINELQDAIKSSYRLNSKIIYSSYDEEVNKKDEDGNNITEIIIHKKYYLLIGGAPSGWEKLYENIHDLGNGALEAISNEIVNNCIAEDFKYIINDGVLPAFDDTNHVLDEPCKTDNGWFYTNPEVLLSRLPNGFTGRDIVKFIQIINKDGITRTYDAFTKIREVSFMSNEKFKEYYLYPLYASLMKDPTVEKLAMLLEPLYKQPDDDSIPGDVSDESLDELFRERYERFSAVADDSTQYEDIDEELADDEETENMREEDKL